MRMNKELEGYLGHCTEITIELALIAGSKRCV
jgi:hypothetical protein